MKFDVNGCHFLSLHFIGVVDRVRVLLKMIRELVLRMESSASQVGS